MKRAQVTLDLLMAVLISFFLLTWIQGFIEIQSDYTQKLGMQQETAYTSISLGSVMNTFYTLNPDSDDYSEVVNPEIKSFLEEIDISIEKNSQDDEITLNAFYGDEEAAYSYSVYGNTSYEENCSSIGGKPCVKG